MGTSKRRRYGGNPNEWGWKVNKHTPGPWIARNLSKGIWTVEATSPHVPGKTQEVCRIAGPWNPENYRRNAHLISAAPELLEALERMVRAFNVKEIDPLVAFVTIEQARAAIRKARGEA